MSIRTCIAINQTANDVELKEFGSIIIPANGQYTLSEDNHFYEIKSGEELSGFIADGTLLINDGVGTLDLNHSLNYISPWYTPYDAASLIETVYINSDDWNDAVSTVEANSATVWDSTADITDLSGAIDQNTIDITTNANSIVDNTNRLSGYVDLTSDQIIEGNKTFSNNIKVDGTFTATSAVYLYTENIGLSANFIDLNTNETGSPTEDAGIRVNRGTDNDAELRWNETDDRWEFGIDGNLQPIADTVDISSLSAAIDNNTTNITTVSGDVITNTSNIATNTANILINTNDISTIAAASGGWNDTESTVGTNSANWDSTYSTVLANSATWESAQIPVLSAAPANPDDGDQWIKSPEMLLYSYSPQYSGWVGDQIMTFTASRKSNRASHLYLKGNDGAPTNISPQLLTKDIVVVGMSMTTKNTETWTLELRKNGSTNVEDSLTQTSATENYDMNKASIFSAGDKLSLYCNGTRISYPKGDVYYRFRVGV